MGSVFETIMLVCFGFSWPINAIKAYKSRTAKDTSLLFLLLILLGYVAGIAAKIILGQINFVLWVYVLNIVIVCVNLAIYTRNKRLDTQLTKISLAKGVS